MGFNSQKLLIGSFDKGLVTDRPVQLLDNNAFPVVENAYIWRKRIKKKPGTEKLQRLSRDLSAQALGSTDGAGAFSGNIRTILSLETDSQLARSLLVITIGAQVFTDNGSGVLSNGAGGTGTVNYTTMAITLQTAPVLAATPIAASFEYYPSLPSMGIELYEVNLSSVSPINEPTVVFFDTKYAYEYDYALSRFYDASFYKMPSPQNRVIWQGADYQQFFSVSYQNALFVSNNVAGFHFKAITNISVGANARITIPAHGLNVNDKLFLNEIFGMVEANERTVTVTVVVDANNVDTDLNSTTFTPYASGGIAQYLTNRVTGLGDGIRWYDGFGPGFGFVNFAPPLQRFNSSTLTSPSYLVGALFFAIYQNQMLCFGTFERTSAGSVQYFPNRFRYSQIGTVFYAGVTPSGGSSTPDAWFDNIPGKGGFVDIDTNDKLIEASINQEVLIVGTETTKRKITGTNNPLQPYVIQTISPEFGSESTFASIPLDRGVLAISDVGFTITTSYDCKRFDVDIPDQVFQINNIDNGNERVCAVRDYSNELIYFNYPQSAIQYEDGSDAVFPTRCLVFNYRDNLFSVFKEQYTTYGYFRGRTAKTWADFPVPWSTVNIAWSAGTNYARFSDIIGGNQQGYIMKRESGTFPDLSHYIKSISGSTITSPGHCLEEGDYIEIEGCVGVTGINDQVFQVNVLTDDTFSIDGTPTGTYLGGGEYRILDQMLIKTKTFPLYWENGMGMRVGKQRFLLGTTDEGEITVQIFSQQNSSQAINDPSYAPFLIGNDTVRTRPDESLGLNDAAASQSQIWHRLSNSFTGDTIQIGFTFSDAQMRDLSIQRAEFTLFGIEIDTFPSKVLN